MGWWERVTGTGDSMIVEIMDDNDQVVGLGDPFEDRPRMLSINQMFEKELEAIRANERKLGDA